MKLLALTNLYPPQELGGYGRCIADFVWGLQERGHELEVLTSDEPHLGDSSTRGPSGERVHRELRLKGSYQGGVSQLQDQDACAAIDRSNALAISVLVEKAGPFDGVLVGNLDLLGLESLQPLLQCGIPLLHHVGFVNPPFPASWLPKNQLYKLVAASHCVREALERAGFPADLPVVYPGARCELFGQKPTGRTLPAPLDGRQVAPGQLGTHAQPLKICFAGLLMGSKGAHTLVAAMALLRKRGLHVQGHLAGGRFQSGYSEQLQAVLDAHDLSDVRLVGQLHRDSLARLFRLHHVCVFPSIHPEAFGIVGAEAMASGVALISSGVGGASELFDDQVSGLRFQADNVDDLANKLEWICHNPERLISIAREGERVARDRFSVRASAQQLEVLFSQTAQKNDRSVLWL